MLSNGGGWAGGRERGRENERESESKCERETVHLRILWMLAL